MRFKLLGLAGLVLALAPVTASAADLATLSCVRQEVPADAAAGIRDASARMSRGERTAKTPPEAMDALRAAMARCKQKHGWSDKAADAAGLYTLASIRYEDLGPYAEANGIKIADVTAALAGMTAEERERLVTGDQGGSAAFTRELTKRIGTTPPSYDISYAYGRLSVNLLVQQRTKASFMAN